MLQQFFHYLLSAFTTAHHHYNSEEPLGLQKDSKVDDHMTHFVLRLERHFFCSLTFDPSAQHVTHAHLPRSYLELHKIKIRAVSRQAVICCRSANHDCPLEGTPASQRLPENH